MPRHGIVRIWSHSLLALVMTSSSLVWAAEPSAHLAEHRRPHQVRDGGRWMDNPVTTLLCLPLFPVLMLVIGFSEYDINHPKPPAAPPHQVVIPPTGQSAPAPPPPPGTMVGYVIADTLTLPVTAVMSLLGHRNYLYENTRAAHEGRQPFQEPSP